MNKAVFVKEYHYDEIPLYLPYHTCKVSKADSELYKCSLDAKYADKEHIN